MSTGPRTLTITACKKITRPRWAVVSPCRNIFTLRVHVNCVITVIVLGAIATDIASCTRVAICVTITVIDSSSTSRCGTGCRLAITVAITMYLFFFLSTNHNKISRHA